MGTVRIGDYIDTTCRHPEHSPKARDAQVPGVYRHTCPQCEREVEFTMIHTRASEELMSVVLSSSLTAFKEGKPWPWNTKAPE